MIDAARFEALGSTVTILACGECDMAETTDVVRRELARIDLACSRFREDSELMRLTGKPGWQPAGSLLRHCIGVALDAAHGTDGLVTPTVGEALIGLGYDRDYAVTWPRHRPMPDPAPAPDWRDVELDDRRQAVRIGAGVRLDLGATGKAIACDLALAAAARHCEGLLLSLGGDLATSGTPPEDGWPVGIADGHRDLRPATTVSIHSGALATSSTTQRRWRAGERDVHHIIDPRTGLPAEEIWRTVTVAAGTCVQANTASTAAIVLGRDAPAWLSAHGLPARLVSAEGDVRTTCGWAAEPVGVG